MPGLKNLLQSVDSQSQQKINIRVLAVECMGYLIESVASDSIGNDLLSELQQISQSFTVQIQVGNLQTELQSFLRLSNRCE